MKKNEISPNIWCLQGDMPGKIITIMAWVHGNELSWVTLLQDLKNNLQVMRWKVYIISCANPRAIEQNIRQTEKNMNRSFHNIPQGSAYEDIRAQELLPFLRESDVLLDIHNTLNTENSIPFLISEHANMDQYFPVNTVVSGLDALHPGGSDGYMNSIGKVGLCIESGSIYDPRGTEIARDSVLNFLRATGAIEWKPAINTNQTKYHLDTIIKAKSTNLQFVKKWLDFEQVSQCDVVAYDDGVPIFAPYDGVIVFTYEPKQVGDEVCVFGKKI